MKRAKTISAQGNITKESDCSVCDGLLFSPEFDSADMAFSHIILCYSLSQNTKETVSTA